MAKIDRDVYLDHMTYQGFERPILVELFGPLVGLEEEWRAQGATPAELDLTAFDFDYVERAGVAVNVGQLGGLEAMVVEETTEYIIASDRLGRRTKMYKQVASIPLPLDYPVVDMDDWRRIKRWFEFDEARFAADWLPRAQRARAERRLLCASIPGGFDLPRQLLGAEGACLACHLNPELIHDILATAGETAFRVLERVSSQVLVDQLSVHEDCAGRSGALFGPSQIETFVKPYYRRIWDMLSERGTRIFQQDSDGNLNGVLDSFIAAGINSSLPMEPAAGMDIVEVRRQFGTRLAFMGGIDKHALRRTRDDIVRELEAKVPPLRDTPGVVFGLDHRIPPGTPLEHYRFYVQTVRDMLGLPPAEPGRSYVWQRMAF